VEGNGSNFHKTWSRTFITLFLRWCKIMVSTKLLETNVDKFNTWAKSLPLPSQWSRLPVTINDSWLCPMLDSGNCVCWSKYTVRSRSFRTDFFFLNNNYSDPLANPLSTINQHRLHTGLRLFIFDSVWLITCLVKSVFFICYGWRK
jgi:hypothetical protein